MGNPLSSSQVADLARPLLGMVDTILEYYKDPAHEKAFQEWYTTSIPRNLPMA